MRTVFVLLLLGFTLTACARPTVIPSGAPLFTDDFSNPKSGWNRDDAANYSDGAYQIAVAEPDMKVWANPGRSFADVVIEVDATTVAGPMDNDFGVQCRARDSKNYYFFLISADGYQAIGKVIKGEASFLSADSMQASDAVQQGNVTNHLRAACVGNKLTLTVNGQMTAQVTDSSLTEGDVGLMAGSYTEGGVQITFDNLKVTQP
ncbi:MAG: hypothetical protein HY260_07160 [Chloroflexi bacterium]|nr:hypothetical protein [Chloroflexota bacterium]